MAFENYSNAAQTTLNGAITSGATSITVAGAGSFPSVGQYRILVDSEIMLVTAGQGTTAWTVTRAQDNTLAASHSNAATVTHVLTAASLLGLYYFDVRANGAKGDGVTDDTTAIQNTINSCQTAGGGTIFLPQGNFKTTAALNITSNVRIALFGWGATIQPAANTDGLFISQANGATAAGCELYGLTIDGQNRSGTVGIRIRDTDRAVVTDCRIANCVTGVQVESFTASRWAEENSISDSFIYNCTTGVNFAIVSGTTSLGETHMFNVGISGSTTGIAINTPATFYRCRLLGITIWPVSNGTGLKIDGDVRDSEFIIDFENVNSQTNLTGVNVTTNALNLDKLRAHFAFTGSFTTQVSDSTAKGAVWTDGIHVLTTSAFAGIVQDWGFVGDANAKVRIGSAFAGGGGIQFGLGGASPVDINIYRAGTGTFKTDGAFARSRQTPTEAVLVSGIDATTGELVSVTLTAARLVGAPLNPLTGQRLTFTLIQDGTGGRAVTWNAVFKVSWSDTGNTASKRSSISFYYDGTNWNQDGAQTPYV